MQQTNNYLGKAEMPSLERVIRSIRLHVEPLAPFGGFTGLSRAGKDMIIEAISLDLGLECGHVAALMGATRRLA